MDIDILAFGAHPDDVELGCAGTISKAVFEGKKVGIIDLTLGEMATRGTIDVRSKEAQISGELLGVIFRENMNFKDGFFTNDQEHQLKVIECIRKYKPDTVLCNAQDDRHIDHPKAASLVSDSCFLSGLVKVKTKFENTDQLSWRPKSVYHYIQWKNSSPDFLVDISGFVDLKLEAIKAYRSQFFDPNNNEPETLISKKNFLNDVINRSADLGRLIGVDNAEGFTTNRVIGINNLNDIK